jgi:hypothetical protein
MIRTITVTGGNLFEVASRFLGDAELWATIAVASGVKDPWLQGLTTLNIPSGSAPAGAALSAS